MTQQNRNKDRVVILTIIIEKRMIILIKAIEQVAFYIQIYKYRLKITKFLTVLCINHIKVI